MANCDGCGITDIQLIPDIESRRKVRDASGRHTGYRVDMTCNNCMKTAAEATFSKDQWVTLMMALGNEHLIPQKWAMDYVTGG